jgi:lysophospholipid acyltransferase (LPLAT)-like uncharacterized protein
MITLLSRLIYIFIKLMLLSCRFKYVGRENYQNIKDSSGRYIFALWHRNLISSALSMAYTPAQCLISSSKDGQLAYYTLEKLGGTVVQGSSRRGGKKALLTLIKNLKNGIPAAITVDGPTGPAEFVKGGIIDLARHSDASIIPICATPNRYFILKKTWDRMIVPLPFSTITVNYGTPISLESGYDRSNLDQYKKIIKGKLNTIDSLAQ